MIEKRLVSDFCAEKMSDYRLFFHLSLGDFYAGQLEHGLTNNERKALGNWRYYCDAVGISKKDLVLIEGAIKFDSCHVGKVLGYSLLVSRTPELTPYLHLPFRAIAVAPIFDGLAQVLCEKFHIEMHWFAPAYVSEYLKTLELRKQRSSMTLLPSMARHGSRYTKQYRV